MAIEGFFLAACRVHGDIEIGKIAAKKVMELKPYCTGAFVMGAGKCKMLS